MKSAASLYSYYAYATLTETDNRFDNQFIEIKALFGTTQ